MRLTMKQQKLDVSFFDRHHLDVARDMGGTHLDWDGVSGMVVETEACAATDNPACHVSFRTSARAFFESRTPGIVYAYISYGIHWMLNVLASNGLVLIRAVEPMTGIRRMQVRRKTQNATHLCSGPGKIGQALSLGCSDHGSSVLTHRRFLLPRNEQFDSSQIVTDARLGLSVGLDRPWRFLLKGNPHVSVPHGKALAKSRTRLRQI